MDKANFIQSQAALTKKIILPFEEALEQAGFGLFNYFLILIGGLALANVFVETVSIGFILPVAECDLNLTNIDKGVLSAMGYVGIIVSSHLWGLLADTKGRRAVIMPTLIIGYIVTIASSFSFHLWVLILLRFMNGFCISGSSATIYAYVGEFHTIRNRSRAVMASSFIYSVGGMFLPVIGWGVINQSWSLPIPFLGIVYLPWRLFIVVCGTFGISGGLAILFYPESPKFLLSIGKEKEAIEVIKKMHKWNLKSEDLQIDGILPEKDIIVRNSAERGNFCHLIWTQTIEIFKPNFLRCTVIICTIQFWMYVIFGVSMWFPHVVDAIAQFRNKNPDNSSFICDIIYAKESELNQDPKIKHCTRKLESSTFLYSLTIETLVAVGFAILGTFINKVRKTYILFVILVVFGACGLACINIQNLQVALCIYVLFFVSFLGVQVLCETTVELYPTHLRGMVLCISLMAGRLGGIFGSNMDGLLLGSNCELTFYIAAIALIVCGFLGLLLPKEIRVADGEKVLDQ